MSLFSELQRRGIFPVAAAYTVVAWLLVQVADVMLPAFNAPDWVLRASIILMAIGFPIALALSWFFEITPEGVKRSEDMPRDYSSASPVNRYLVLFIISVLTAAVILFAVDRFAWQDEKSGSLFQDTAEKSSVAVLPFANRSALPDDQFFSEGIHDDLLTRLAKITTLKVTSRTSVMRYRDTTKSIPEIGGELGVTAILEGGVQRAGDQVRINVQLIDAASDEHLWAETYDRKLTAENLFAIQTEIVRAIAGELKTALSPHDAEQIEQVPTRNLAAYEAYLRGRQYLNRRYNEDSLRQALNSFYESALLDPNFAGAYAGECEAQLSWYRLGSDTNRFQAAEAACQKALSIDPNMTEVRVALGRLQRYNGNYARATEEILRVLAVEPDNVDALLELGLNYQSQGKTAEAEEILLRATEIAPGNWQTFDILGFHYQRYSERPDNRQQAIIQALKVVELVPDSASAYNNLGNAYFRLGQFEAAKTAWDRALQLEPSRSAYTNRGLAYYYDGQFEEAARMQLKAIELAPSDHRAWGRLGDAWRFMEGHEEASLGAYQSAIEQAEPMLKIDDQDWLTLGLLATYYVRTGRTDEAIEMMPRVLSLADHDPEALLYQAIVLDAVDDFEGAKLALSQAVEQDDSYQIYFSRDPDLSHLRDLD